MTGLRPILAIDIGSTWTKGALFLHRRERLIVEREAVTPTTTDDLCRGFWSVCDRLLPGFPERSERDLSDLALTYTSSAKGGLSIAASGIVPELTAQAAREAALSAGGRVTRVFSYRLSASDLAVLEQENPDILLVCGGTDGGNETIVRHNVGVIATSRYAGTVLFAGNRAMAEEASRLLLQGGKEYAVADNVLPALGMPEPLGAREAIRQIFLSRIVAGKGLHRLVEQTGQTPVPTPLAMLDYVGIIHRRIPELGDFCLVDLGGATTDYYSASPVGSVMPGTIVRGLPESIVKRSVEGDLGMRVSAASLLEAAKRSALSLPDTKGEGMQELESYVAFVSAHPDHLPVDRRQLELDAVLAGWAVRLSARRHAGRIEMVPTASGPVPVQRGKDLRAVTTMIGSGGFFSLAELAFSASDFALPRLDEAAREILGARPQRLFLDRGYRLPLLAAAALIAPVEAALTGFDGLTLSGDPSAP